MVVCSTINREGGNFTAAGLAGNPYIVGNSAARRSINALPLSIPQRQPASIATPRSIWRKGGRIWAFMHAASWEASDMAPESRIEHRQDE